MDESKGVKVYLAANTEKVHHPKGSGIHIVDGHLKVHTGDPNRPLAIYAPGKWTRAVVVLDDSPA